MRSWVVLALLSGLAQSAAAGIVISEWMYSGTDGEFIEFTNVGPDAVDMTNWAYSDSDAQPGDLSFLDVFGVVQPGESVILTEAEPTTFRTAWALDAGIKVFGLNANSNLGRADMINLYNADGQLIDELSFGDQVYPGTPRTQNKSCNIPATDYGYTVAQTTWSLAAVGDSFGSWASTGADIGSPGVAPVPEPASVVLFAFCGLVLAHRRG